MEVDHHAILDDNLCNPNINSFIGNHLGLWGGNALAQRSTYNYNQGLCTGLSFYEEVMAWNAFGITVPFGERYIVVVFFSLLLT